jgi:hypothetical protein
MLLGDETEMHLLGAAPDDSSSFKDRCWWYKIAPPPADYGTKAQKDDLLLVAYPRIGY